MKKKFLNGLILLFCTVICCSCSIKKENEKKGRFVESDDLPMFIETSYKYEEYISDGEEVIRPCGICFFSDSIIVCDKEMHCLHMIDLEGHYLEKIGKLGSGSKEFIQPMGITSYNNELYVLDAGNNRIQIFDKDIDFVREIELQPLVHEQAGYRYIDIAVDKNGTIYVSTDSVGKLDAHIYTIDDNNIEHIEMPFVGYLTEYKGEIYAAETLELYTEGNVEGGSAGENNLYHINENRLDKILELPNKFSPNDFCMVDGELYLLSGLWGALTCISNESNELGTLLLLNEPAYGMYIEYIPDTNEFYISDSQNNRIYRVHP